VCEKRCRGLYFLEADLAAGSDIGHHHHLFELGMEAEEKVVTVAAAEVDCPGYL
jgi:hypothetical protein